MLNAKLFAALAGILLFVAFLGREKVLPHMNLWLRVGNISLGPFYWQLFGALVCGILAFAYFSVARLIHRPPSQHLGLVAFSLVAAACAAWLIASFLTRTNSPPDSWLVVVPIAAIFGFGSGVALAVVNLAYLGWALSRQ